MFGSKSNLRIQTGDKTRTCEMQESISTVHLSYLMLGNDLNKVFSFGIAVLHMFEITKIKITIYCQPWIFA